MTRETRGERRAAQHPGTDNNYNRTRAEMQLEPLPLSPAELKAALDAADTAMRAELAEEDQPDQKR